MSEPTFGSEIDNLRAEIATLRQEREEQNEAAQDDADHYANELAACRYRAEAAEAENARLRAALQRFKESWLPTDQPAETDHVR